MLSAVEAVLWARSAVGDYRDCDRTMISSPWCSPLSSLLSPLSSLLSSSDQYSGRQCLASTAHRAQRCHQPPAPAPSCQDHNITPRLTDWLAGWLAGSPPSSHYTITVSLQVSPALPSSVSSSVPLSVWQLEPIYHTVWTMDELL